MILTIQGKNDLEVIYNYLQLIKTYIYVSRKSELKTLAAVILKLNKIIPEQVNETKRSLKAEYMADSTIDPAKLFPDRLKKNLRNRMNTKGTLKAEVFAEADKFGIFGWTYTTFNMSICNLRKNRFLGVDENGKDRLHSVLDIYNIPYDKDPFNKLLKPVLLLKEGSKLEINFDLDYDKGLTEAI